MELREFIRMNLQRHAGDDDGSDAGGDNNSGGNDDGDGDDNAGDGGNGGNDGKTFTQDELDAIIQKRLNRAKKQWQEEADNERKKQQMDETERLKAEKEEAERKATASREAANERLKRAEAKVQAASLGVKPDRLDYVLRLVDLSDIEVEDDGEPDAKAIKSAVERVLKDVPELKGAGAGNVGGGSNPGDDANSTTKNPWSKEHLNLTEQGRIARENPELAKRLRAEAGKK